MGALKPDKFPVQLLALTAITVDHAIQSRVSTSMEYQREFSEAMLRGDVFPFVVVFFDGKIYWLADGFHRYGAAKQAARLDSRFKAIRAEVREGTKRDATIFSAGANIKFSIPRTAEDIRKAVFMLMADPEWLKKCIADIARHVGCSPKTATNYRADYCREHGMEIPRSERVSKVVAGIAIYQTSPKSFVTRIGRKTIYLGSSREAAEAKAREISEARKAEAATRLTDLSVSSLLTYLVRRGIESRAIGNPPKSGLGQAIVGVDFVMVSARLGDAERVRLAVGSVLLNQAKAGANLRAIIVCDAVPNSEAIRFAVQLGVEFLAAENLLTGLKGTDKPTED